MDHIEPEELAVLAYFALCLGVAQGGWQLWRDQRAARSTLDFPVHHSSADGAGARRERDSVEELDFPVHHSSADGANDAPAADGTPR